MMTPQLSCLYEILWEKTKQADEVRAKLFDCQRDQYFLQKQIAEITGERFEIDAKFECGETKIINKA